jgi:exopolysaccharide/PEP-CTERM locus tyrosine autokinase
MERIKAALERARQERQSAPNALSDTAPGAARGEVAEQMTYTQTRSIKVSERIMAERRVISSLPSKDLTDAYKILRTQVLQRLLENNWNALAVTSPGEQEGKTLTAINLAISLAMEVNYTVLLVDADLRHPSIHEYFGFKPEYGLSDYLTDNIPIQDMLVHPEGIGRCVILPGGKPLPNSSELLNSPKMSHLVDELKTRYPSRIVVFDLPPLLTTSDALAFSPYVDAALLVIEDGRTTAQELERAAELLKGTNLLGTTLNKVRSIPLRDKRNPGWLSRLLSSQG